MPGGGAGDAYHGARLPRPALHSRRWPALDLPPLRLCHILAVASTYPAMNIHPGLVYGVARSSHAEAAALLYQARCTIALHDGPPLVFHDGHCLAHPPDLPLGTDAARAWGRSVCAHVATEWALQRALGAAPASLRAPRPLEDPADSPTPAPVLPASGLTGMGVSGPLRQPVDTTAVPDYSTVYGVFPTAALGRGSGCVASRGRTSPRPPHGPAAAFRRRTGCAQPRRPHDSSRQGRRRSLHSGRRARV